MPPTLSTLKNEVVLQMLDPDSWAVLIQSWLAQGCLAMFGPELTDGLKVTPEVLAKDMALPCASAVQQIRLAAIKGVLVGASSK